MTLSCILLGISSSTPTKDRNTVSMAIKYNGEVILFDVSEGAQQQLMKTKTSYMDINNIFISHFHADHFLGLPGLIATMSLHERSNPLTIYGPQGIDKRVNSVLNAFEIYPKFELRFVTIKEGIIYQNDSYHIYAKKVNHSIETYGFIFKEKDVIGKFVKEKALALGIPEGPMYNKLRSGVSVIHNGKTFNSEDVMDYSHKKIGKKISYFVDLLDNSQLDSIRESDIVFHEATFLEEDKEQSRKTKHSTATDVARMIEKSKSKKWILMNFSARYKELEPLLNEAQKYFPDSELGVELKEYKL